MDVVASYLSKNPLPVVPSRKRRQQKQSSLVRCSSFPLRVGKPCYVTDMADPATVIGTLSATVALAQTCAGYISKFKNVHKDASDLLTEVVAVGYVLNSLRAYLAEQAGKTGKSPYTQTSVLFIALNGCQMRLKEIKDVVEPLAGRKRLRGFWSRLKWPMERDDVRDAVIALHRYAQIFHFAVNLDGL